MKIKILIISCILTLACAGCSSTIESLLTSIKINKHNELAFFGPITRKNVNKIKRVYEEAEKKPTVLRMNSRGGNLIAGGILGDWVHFLQLDVKVTGSCYSACASFVFPAGKRSMLGKNAKLLWHGSSQSPKLFIKQLGRISEEEAVATHGESGEFDLEKIRSQEKSFYRHLGIDPSLPIYGESDEYQHLHADLEYDDKYKGFYYSIDDMKTMGINIVLIDGEWHGSDPSTSRYNNAYKVTIPKKHKR